MSDIPLENYCKYLENLTREDISHLGIYVSDNIHFRDPFNDCLGLENYKIILNDMFEHLEPFKFQVLEHSVVEEKRTGYIHWDLTLTLRPLNNQELKIDGISRLTFDSNCKVMEHIDYWDAASSLYEKIPFIGYLLKKVRKRISSELLD
tara:strand:+ start:85 stop:531 length:447 start_codon:yes stop_codon:yes gene_type:complete